MPCSFSSVAQDRKRGCQVLLCTGYLSKPGFPKSLLANFAVLYSALKRAKSALVKVSYRKLASGKREDAHSRPVLRFLNFRMAAHAGSNEIMKFAVSSSEPASTVLARRITG
jgi:hypothetical protein